MALTGYIQVIYETVMTPATCAVVAWLKRKEHVNAFDYGTDFSPFHISKT